MSDYCTAHVVYDPEYILHMNIIKHLYAEKFKD
jgi:hypothetical protein